MRILAGATLWWTALSPTRALWTLIHSHTTILMVPPRRHQTTASRKCMARGLTNIPHLVRQAIA